MTDLRSLGTLLLVLLTASPSAAQAPRRLVKERPAKGRFVKTDQGYMLPYSHRIPGTEVSFEMVPIPGGTLFVPKPGTKQTIRIAIPPFWMGRHEVTWGEYAEFMSLRELARGGGYLDTAADCRATARAVSSRDFWQDDPQLPHSVHWLATEGYRAIGFRIVRPLRDEGAEHRQRSWDARSEPLLTEIRGRIESGRGSRVLVDQELPEALKPLREKSLRDDRPWLEKTGR